MIAGAGHPFGMRGAGWIGVRAFFRVSLCQRADGGRCRPLVPLHGGEAGIAFCRACAWRTRGADTRGSRRLVGLRNPKLSVLFVSLSEFRLGRAKDFGTSPFYAYLYLPLATPFAPMILFLLVATLVAWLRRGSNVLTWASAPYVVLLSITAHKEVRFLYPLFPFLPFFIVFALAAEPPLGARFASVLRWFASGRSLQFGYLINICGFASITLVPLYADFSTYRMIENESYAREGPLVVAVVHRTGTDAVLVRKTADAIYQAGERPSGSRSHDGRS